MAPIPSSARNRRKHACMCCCALLWPTIISAARGDVVYEELMRKHEELLQTAHRSVGLLDEMERMESGLQSKSSNPAPGVLSLSVVPFGVQSPTAWTRQRMIPSGKITVFVTALDNETQPDNLVGLRLLKWGHGRRGVVEILNVTAWFSPWYHLNIGPTSAGSYVLEVAPNMAVTTFTIGTQHPEYDEGTTTRSRPIDCLDLPAVEPYDPSMRTDGVVAPPVNVPPQLCERYTMGGDVAVGRMYLDDLSDHSKSYQSRSYEEIEDMVSRVRQGETYYYGETDTWLYAALKSFPIKDMSVLIIGSNVPWYEAMCLAYGAASCITVDYNQLRYDHPKLQTLRPWELKTMTAEAQLPLFDVVWSISSFEHDGLGRYGDPLDPDADLRAMQDVKQYLAPEGLLMLAVPVGRDRLYWNVHRVYGRKRLPLLLQGWRIVESYGFRYDDFNRPTSGEHQPVLVLMTS